MKKITLLLSVLFLAFAFISLASAAVDPAYTYKSANQIEIKNPCYNNGTYCTAGATCKITVYDTQNAIILNNVNMTNQLNYFNISITNSGNATWPQGRYSATQVCTDLGKSGSQTFYFDVTATGKSDSSNIMIFIILLVISALLLLAALLTGNEYLGFISGVVFILTGIFVIIYGIGNWSSFYTDGVGIVILGLGLIFLLAAAYGAITSNNVFMKVKDEYDYFESDNDWFLLVIDWQTMFKRRIGYKLGIGGLKKDKWSQI